MGKKGLLKIKGWVTFSNPGGKGGTFKDPPKERRAKKIGQSLKAPLEG